MEDIYSLLEVAKTNEDYRTILEMLRWFDGFSCPRCGCSEAYRIQTRGLMECKNCGLQVSATAWTFLHGVRNLGVWVKAILSFLDIEGKSAVAVSKLFNSGYISAWFMMQKIRMVLQTSFDEAGDRQFLPCSMLRAALFKASVGDDLFDMSKEPGTEFQRAPSSGARAAALVAFLLGTFYGVSRKYSQLYALEFAYRNLCESVEPAGLLLLFLRGRPISRQMIIGYVSPHMILVSSGAKSIASA